MERRRGRRREDHGNHEAWAIPYGDLVTLLLAFFVVMYSISQVNEAKYRVVSDSLSAAFRGEPASLAPIQVGERALAANNAQVPQLPDPARASAVRELVQQTEAAMGSLIQQGLVDVSWEQGTISIAIRSDILFASGSALLSAEAQPVIRLLGEVLREFPVDISVEGHTDNVPVVSGAYPSNWELSTARALSVVHLMVASGVPPQRLSAVGYGEYRPVMPNTSPDSRNANRRVVLSVEVGQALPAHAAQAAAAASVEPG